MSKQGTFRALVHICPHALALSLLILPVLVLGAMSQAVAAQTSGASENQASVTHHRGGFTLLLNLGVGFQRDQFLEETNTGLAGLNLGLGGFLNQDLALMFRVSGTNVSLGSVNQVSGFGGPSLQYWINDRFNIEGGVGLGFWDTEFGNESGLGLLLATAYSFWTNGKHNLYIGGELASSFADPDPVHNIGVVFGWQML